MIFENKGKENTLETLHIALNAAKERGTTLVVASNAGDTLIELIKMQEELGTNVPMVMVGQAYGYPKQGVNTMTDERRAELTAAGVHIIELNKPVVCVGGSARGADTACIITPAYTADCLDTKIHEILCKPGLY